jgi:peptidoglycan-associated lipoprotein
MVRPLLSCALLLCWSFALCSAQRNSDQQQPAAPAAMPSDNAATPPPTPPDDRQDFAQNVKDVYFNFDRYNLRADDHATLQKDAEWLKAHPNLFFTIEGDADERGSIVYNVVLSNNRARVTREALQKLGVPEGQILFAVGWGKLYPVCETSDESCWSENRRSHLAPWPPDLTANVQA